MKKRTVIALAALSLMAVSGTTVFAATKPVMETEDTADSELFMPGEIKEDAEEAEFEGNWKAVEVGIDKSIASLDTIGFDSVYATAEDGKVNVYVKMTLLDNLLKIEDADYDYQDGTNSFDISDMAVDSGKTIRDAVKELSDGEVDDEKFVVTGLYFVHGRSCCRRNSGCRIILSYSLRSVYSYGRGARAICCKTNSSGFPACLFVTLVHIDFSKY